MRKIYIILCLLMSVVGMGAQNAADSTATSTSSVSSVSGDGSAMDAMAVPDEGVSAGTMSADGTSAVTKVQADSAYIRNDFAAAVELYERILATEGESADLHYNLGNSYYKLGQIAKAVLCYERALLMNPGDGDIRHNLELARSKTVDKVTPQSEIFFITWIQSLINLMSEKAWARLGIAAFILTLLSLSLFVFGKRVVLKKIGFIGACCLLVLTVLANVFASSQKSKIVNRESAIIMAPSVTVKSTPDAGGTDLFILHEGRKVQIKDGSMREWKEIQLEDGNVGWVPTGVIEII